MAANVILQAELLYDSNEYDPTKASTNTSPNSQPTLGQLWPTASGLFSASLLAFLLFAVCWYAHFLPSPKQ